MIGLGGNLVLLDSGMLSLEDIATGLSRAPRFVGQTLGLWTVVDHLLAGMVYSNVQGWSKELQLHFGLHDAHEAMTGDVPTTFKTDDLRKIQRALDVRLYANLHLRPPTWAQQDKVHELDGDMLLAEAKTVCPETTYRRVVFERGHREATLPHCLAVQEVLSWNKTGEEAAELWLTSIRQLIQYVNEPWLVHGDSVEAK
jgi:hypothetical protein